MKIFFLLVLLFVATISFSSPQVVFAQGGLDDNDGGLDGNDGGLDPAPERVGSAGSSALTNPLNSTSIQGFFLAILDILLVFAIPIVVLFIMYAGFLYVTAQGDETKIRTAHAALTWSIIGGVIILGANLIIDVIQNTVNAL